MRDGSSGYSWYSECVIYLRCGYSGRKCLSIRYVYTWEHDREMASQVHIQRTQFMQQEVGLNSQLKSRSSRSPLTRVESSRERGQKSSRVDRSSRSAILSSWIDRVARLDRFRVYGHAASIGIPVLSFPLQFPFLWHSHCHSRSHGIPIVPIPMHMSSLHLRLWENVVIMLEPHPNKIMHYYSEYQQFFCWYPHLTKTSSSAIVVRPRALCVIEYFAKSLLKDHSK